MELELTRSFSPKYSLIKSVVKNTIGQGKIPILITKGPIWINLPPINSAVTALVIKIPARITKTKSFRV